LIIMRSVLDEKQVKALFVSCQKECDVLLGLFGLAVPEWDRVEYVLEGKPQIGEEGWHAIYKMFCRFNEEHPGENVFPGGLWLGMGFSVNNDLKAWEVDASDMEFVFAR
jgi:hypothetical protein